MIEFSDFLNISELTLYMIFVEYHKIHLMIFLEMVSSKPSL